MQADVAPHLSRACNFRGVLRSMPPLTPFPAAAEPEAVVRMLADKLGKIWGSP